MSAELPLRLHMQGGFAALYLGAAGCIVCKVTGAVTEVEPS